jgi:hypothetical protein
MMNQINTKTNATIGFDKDVINNGRSMVAATMSWS